MKKPKRRLLLRKPRSRERLLSRGLEKRQELRKRKRRKRKRSPRRRQRKWLKPRPKPKRKPKRKPNRRRERRKKLKRRPASSRSKRLRSKKKRKRSRRERRLRRLSVTSMMPGLLKSSLANHAALETSKRLINRTSSSRNNSDRWRRKNTLLKVTAHLKANRFGNKFVIRPSR